MGFFNQLLLLSWKNFTFRRRQPLRVLVEIFWPLCLFFILVIVRLRPDIKEDMPECHYNSRAMPSAGTIAFLQSYICNLNASCASDISPEPGDTSIFNASLADTFIESLTEVLSDSSVVSFVVGLGEDISLLMEVFATIGSQPDLLGNFTLFSSVMDLDEVERILANSSLAIAPDVLSPFANASLNLERLFNSNLTDTLTLASLAGNLFLGTSPNVDLLTDFQLGLCTNQALLDMFDFQDPNAALNLQTQICSITAENFTTLSQALFSSTSVPTVIEEINKGIESIGLNGSFSTLPQLFEFISNSSDLPAFVERFGSVESTLLAALSNMAEAVNVTEVFSSFLCGIDRLFDTTQIQDNVNSDQDASQMFEYILNTNPEDMQDIVDQYLRVGLSTECANLFANFDSTLGIFWDWFKPILIGKILYTPETPATRKIIQEANGMFESINAFLNLLSGLDTTLPTVESFITNNGLALNTFFDTDGFTPSNVVGDFNWLDALNSTTSLLNSSGSYFNCFFQDRFVPHDSLRSLIDGSLELIQNQTLWAGIVFDNIEPDAVEIPPTVKYRIRMDSDKVDDTDLIRERYWRPGPEDNLFTDYRNFLFGFIYIQDLIDHAIIRLQTNVTDLPGIYLQQFPYPCWISDNFVFAISRSLPIFMVISWIYSVAMIIKGIVYEKEMRLKEVMKMMGLGNGVHWLAWFINAFVVMLITITIFCIIMRVGLVLEYTDPSVVFVYMLGYTISTITMCFLISVFFSKANLAAVCGGFLYFVVFLPYTQLIQWDEELSTTAKIIACLSSNIAMGYGCNYLALYEEQAIGVQWSNIHESPVVDDSFNMQLCIVMLFADAAIYMLLAWYIEAVFPGEYGIPRKWYFPIQKSYWCGETAKSKVTAVDDEIMIDTFQNGNSNFEPESEDHVAGVKVRNLRKVYPGGKVAVDGLTLNFYQDQITSFLGHNGAGKTTTMSILTGLFPPTSGTAYIYGKDVLTSIDEIRCSLGMCPQHNVLFDSLTVEEHIWFYARLKGRTNAEVKGELTEMIKDIALPHKRKEMSKNLSGGMKRKLSVAIAFVGGSKTVILDEPTAGVDPYARRAIWELLLKLRKGRTIILSTHHMDEADVLGDRIAIISQGKLCTVGSSLFLKNRFGTGYYLTLVREEEDQEIAIQEERGSGLGSMSNRPSTAGSAASSADVKQIHVQPGEEKRPYLEDGTEIEDEGFEEKNGSANNSPVPLPKFPNGKTFSGFSLPRLTAFIKRHVPNAELVENNSMEVSFRLQEGDNHAERFRKLFEALEKSHTDMGISSYGISDTSLEEVFLKVADDNWVEEGAEEEKRSKLEEMSEHGRYPRPVSKLSFRRQNSTSLFSFDLKKKRAESKERLHDNDEDSDVLTGEEAGHDMDTDTDFSGAGKIEMTGKSMVVRQLSALFIKRFHHVRRSKKGFVSEIILPAAFVCLAMIFSLILPPFSERPPLELEPWMYEPKSGSNSLNVFYSNEDPLSNSAQTLESKLLGSPYYGTRCMNPESHTIDGKPCLSSSSINSVWTHVSSNVSDISCSCSSGFQRCPDGAGGPEPSSRELETNDHLLNMTGRNLSDWLVKTNEEYQKRRYGGFSFGIENSLGDLNTSEISGFVDSFVEASSNNQSVFYGSEEIWTDLGTILQTAFAKENAKVWFNNKGWASSVSYMNGLNNLILRTFLPPGKDPQEYGIVTINHPMNFTRDQLDEEALVSSTSELIVAICVIFAMSFVPASFVLFLIEERVSNSKHLQFVSGINPTVYWIANLLWDYMNYSVPAILCLIIFVAFGNDAYTSSTNFPCLLSLLFLYGWSIVPMMYPFSRVFDVPSSAFVALSCLNIFIGTVATLATFILEVLALDDPELADTNDILKQVFLIFPHYCLGRGLLDLATQHLQSEVLSRLGTTQTYDPFEWIICGRNLFAMGMMGIAFIILNFLIEYKFFLSKFFLPKASASKKKQEDTDVAREKERILSGGAADDILRIEGLTKVYWTRGRRGKMTAVDKLYVGVPKGQCFGLLGVNGAGKTTTFKMLTGDISVTDGDAYVNQYSIRKDMVKVCQHMGYCPQFDALDALLTGREHLEFYARLRGVPSSKIKEVADWAIRKLGLLPHADKISSSYSGGNKRKLSTAIALIGNPPLIFLDEPTTGMDPRARRFLWTCINNVVKSGRSVILTSHSMEECEALCSRLAIMVNGTFQCVGSIQHLKNRFGNGYTIVLRVSGHNPNLTPVMEFITSTFPSAKLLEKHHNMVQYQLGTENLSLSQLFSSMEEAKHKYNIEDYSVSQTTLDQVFINFAKKQSDMLDHEHDEEHHTENTVNSDDVPKYSVGIDELPDDRSNAGSTTNLVGQEDGLSHQKYLEEKQPDQSLTNDEDPDSKFLSIRL